MKSLENRTRAVRRRDRVSITGPMNLNIDTHAIYDDKMIYSARGRFVTAPRQTFGFLHVYSHFVSLEGNQKLLRETDVRR